MPDNVTTKKKSIVEPIAFSHGTLECVDIAKSRRFYEEFLGLECVRHVKPPVMMIRLKGGVHVVCVQAGDKVHEQHVFNHWGLDVSTREMVDEAHAKAVKYKEAYGIRKVMDPRELHGDYSFYMQDQDGNWWEIQCIEDTSYEDNFARGDVVPM